MVPVCLIGFTGFKTAKPLVGDKLPLTKIPKSSRYSYINLWRIKTESTIKPRSGIEQKISGLIIQRTSTKIN